MVCVTGILFLIPGCSRIPAFNEERLCLVKNASHLEDTKKSYTRCRSIEKMSRPFERDVVICWYCKTVQEKKKESGKLRRWSLWQIHPGSFRDRSHVKPQEIKTELFLLILKFWGCLSSLGLHAAKATPGKTPSLAEVIIIFFILSSKTAQSYWLQKTDLTASSPVWSLGEDLGPAEAAPHTWPLWGSCTVTRVTSGTTLPPLSA